MTGVTPAWMLDRATVPFQGEGLISQPLKSDFLFVYGILKRGFILDLTRRAEFIGEAMLPSAILYKIGSGVGLRFIEDNNRKVYGEVFKIPSRLWEWLDDIESNGVAYTRKIVEVAVGNPEGPDYGWMMAWVYEHTFPGMKYDRPILNGVYNAHI